LRIIPAVSSQPNAKAAIYSGATLMLERLGLATAEGRRLRLEWTRDYGPAACSVDTDPE
jgi:hypothetical protein